MLSSHPLHCKVPNKLRVGIGIFLPEIMDRRWVPLKTVERAALKIKQEVNFLKRRKENPRFIYLKEPEMLKTQKSKR